MHVCLHFYADIYSFINLFEGSLKELLKKSFVGFLLELVWQADKELLCRRQFI